MSPRERLGAGVAAGTHQHGDEGHQARHGGQAAFKGGEDHAGEGGGEHQEHQPGDAVAPDLQWPGAGIGLVGRGHTGHLFDVLGGLLFHNVDDVVDGDDADQPPFLVHHGHGHQVVVGELFRYALLVLGGGGKDHVPVHQILDDHIVVVEQQVLHRDDALQLPVGVGDEADVDGLLILADAADAGDGLLHAHVLFQVHELGSHDAAGGVLRIAEILVDEAAGLGSCGAHDALDHIGGQLFHDIHRVVHVQLLDDPGQLLVGDGVDDALLFRGLQIGEDLRRRLLGQQPEHHGHAVVVDLGEEFRHVELVHFLQTLLQGLPILLLQQLRQLVILLFLDRLIVHGLQDLVLLQAAHLRAV